MHVLLSWTCGQSGSQKTTYHNGCVITEISFLWERLLKTSNKESVLQVRNKGGLDRGVLERERVEVCSRMGVEGEEEGVT